MSSKHGKFATALECMDGRTQKAVSDFIKEKFHVDYVDTITEAGIDGKLGSGEIDRNLLKSIETKIGISVKGHGSKNMVIAGHDDCAGNPVDYKTHKKHLLKATQLIREFNVVKKNNISVAPVFITNNGQEWIVTELE